MLSPQSALADAPVSPFQKVDKTGIIGGIASVIENGIDAAHTGLEGDGMTANTYGIAIILFTLLVRTITLPLTKMQLESSTQMQQIQPLQKKIQAAFPSKNQEQAKNQLTAQLFQAANINPLAGCFPALVQIPVFISLYRALTNLVAEDKLQEGFLWLPSLEGPIYGGQTANWFSSIFSGNPVLGWPETTAYLSLPAILIVSQTIASKILQPQRPEGAVLTSQEQTTQNLVYLLPFLIAVFSLNVPAGLSLYWISSNVLTTVFTLLVKSGIKSNELPPAVQRVMAEVDQTLGVKKDDELQPAISQYNSDMTEFERAMQDKKIKKKAKKNKKKSKR
jgi:YidC/Oxa1 family membrane protein insertase